MTHTRGPWEVIPNYHDAPAGVQTQGGVVICDVFGTFDAGGNFIGQFDNARLVAAAPDLLEAAKTIIAFVDGAGMIGNGDEPIDQLRAALAKANGKAAA